MSDATRSAPSSAGFWGRQNPLLDDLAFQRARSAVARTERETLDRLRRAVLDARIVRPPTADDSAPGTCELVLDAQCGDEVALDRLLARYRDRLRAAVRPRMGKRLRGRLDSEDIVQQTLWTAAQRLDRFRMRNARSLLRWLVRLADNQILDAVHHQDRDCRNPDRLVALHHHNPSDSSQSGHVDVPAAQPTPPEIVAEAEARALILDCLHRLATAERELIRLRAWDGLPWQTIAEQTGRASPNAARMAYAEAVLRLGHMVRRRTGGGGRGDAK